MNQLPLTAGHHYEYPLIIKKLLSTPMRYAKNQEIIYRDSTRFTYSTFFERIHRLASGLDKLGIQLFFCDLRFTICEFRIDGYTDVCCLLSPRRSKIIRED